MNIYLTDMADYAAMNNVCAYKPSSSGVTTFQSTDRKQSSQPSQTPSQHVLASASRNSQARLMYVSFDYSFEGLIIANLHQVEIEVIAHL